MVFLESSLTLEMRMNALVQFQLNFQIIKHFLKNTKFNYAGGLWFRNE